MKISEKEINKFETKNIVDLWKKSKNVTKKSIV
jgi:hypothetical protein